MSDVVEGWTASMVEQQLEEAADTLRRLPTRKVQGYFGVLPQIKHEVIDIADWELLAIHADLKPTPDGETFVRRNSAEFYAGEAFGMTWLE